MRQAQQRQESLAKLLDYILSRRPDEFGLVLDSQGRLAIKELLRALAQEEGWSYVRRSHLEEVVNLLRPGSLAMDQTYIWAVQPGPAELRAAAPTWPPPLLYRAITAKSHEVVATRGLQPQEKRELVLAATPELALRLGRRRDPQPVLVTVQAQRAAKQGQEFFPYGEGLYLSGAIAPEFLQLPPAPKKPAAKPAAEKKPATPPTPGSILVDIQGQPVKPWQEKGRKKDPAWKEAARKQRRRRH
ncbi:MAG: RNA 2'-phosphotransferase [Desulfobacca sp.]|uniref:RNA 2'-phosphotransferase n=1 Tax=Desulfobacca sp. TaxID=2067990 RepID=UPI00404AA616